MLNISIVFLFLLIIFFFSIFFNSRIILERSIHKYSLRLENEKGITTIFDLVIVFKYLKNASNLSSIVFRDNISILDDKKLLLDINNSEIWFTNNL